MVRNAHALISVWQCPRKRRNTSQSLSAHMHGWQHDSPALRSTPRSARPGAGPRPRRRPWPCRPRRARADRGGCRHSQSRTHPPRGRRYAFPPRTPAPGLPGCRRISRWRPSRGIRSRGFRPTSSHRHTARGGPKRRPARVAQRPAKSPSETARRPGPCATSRAPTQLHTPS